MIRPGAPADLAALRGLRAAYTAEVGADGPDALPPTDAVWDGWARRRLSAGDVRVGLAATRIVAYIVWEARGGPHGRLLLVDELFVAPEQRGQRFGSGLLARALDRARVLGLGEVEFARGAAAADAGGLLAQFGFAERDGRLVRTLVLD